MASIESLADPLQTLLTSDAEAVAGEHGVIQRCRKFSGATLLQTLILGWLAHPTARLSQLVQLAALRGVQISPQGLDQRFTPALAAALEALLGRAVQRAVQAAEAVPLPLLQRFAGVYLLDSTTISLPEALADTWPGCGGKDRTVGRAALTLQVCYDLLHGQLAGPLLQAGRAQDRSTPLQHAPLPPGSLRIADLGYFVLAVLRAIGAQGSFWLSRLRVDVIVFERTDQRVDDLADWLGRHADAHGRVDQTVTLGVKERLPARLLAWRVPQALADRRRRQLRKAARRKGDTVSPRRLALADWTILITNLPPARLAAEEALVLARARWQIELLFKLWKQHGQLAVSRSNQPWRRVCEVYAKLLALIIQHWLLVAGTWRMADRSLVKAAQAVRSLTVLLAAALDHRRQLQQVLQQLAHVLSAGTRINPRRKRPNTCQLLLDPGWKGLT